MFIKPVSVSDKWLQENTALRLGLPQVETKAPNESILIAGANIVLPLVVEKSDKFDSIKLAANAELRVGSGKHGQFNSSIDAEESSDHQKSAFWLCTDEETEGRKGVLFKTQEEAEAFSALYKSVANYYQSGLHKQKPISPDNGNYLLLSGNTLDFFEAELRASKQKHILKGDYNLTAAGSLDKLRSPDGSNWVMVSLKKGVDAQAVFPNSYKIQNLLLQNSDAKKFGKLDLPPVLKNEKTELPEKKKSNPLLSCLPFFKAKSKASVEEVQDKSSDKDLMQIQVVK
ncbi:hypothetical protein B1207_06745 [Legionella quinlivanii]|uniref:Uncharacterized protein n=1 Tax=Legionella quinlivanii TaxID=45073 RepID=A0A364LKM2_9GAMM|nr:hypothetical protein [Legionella quinlivanii]RAP37113.1 hypothetical protein B1207_06745 [Legionella quinlivanii]